MNWWFANISWLAAVSLGGLITQVRAECDPRAFVVADVAAIALSDEAELAFVLTASETEYYSFKNSVSARSGLRLISDSANLKEAQDKARKIAEAINFDYKSNYASSLLAQQLSAKAVNAYRECLNHERENPGLRLWIENRAGDYFILGSFWVGADRSQGIAHYDAEPVVIGGTIISKPDDWVKGLTQEVVVQRDLNTDLMIKIRVGGQIGTMLIVKDPPAVTWETKPVKSPRITKVATRHGVGAGCFAGETADCIYPSQPGGYFVVGSAVVTERSSTDALRYAERFRETPDQVCVQMTQSTGACEHRQFAQGRLMALEKFPRAAD
ncbi:hypothetical protein [Ensifer sp. Root127]|uniref:hypothetical protein n=1 Tax=Ensifer sp. Root127 TaxID=1736440 RepID=UPI00070CDE99|nr:hypothetical protein [Ensifer sp. Root127]KQW82037.1 hypothetical protein ASD03_23245 [Ensifer sp. Root127]